MSYDLLQTQHSWLAGDARLSKAAKQLFGLAYRDKLKRSATLTPFWIWSKTQETIASQQWILNLISHDNTGMEGMSKVRKQ